MVDDVSVVSPQVSSSVPHACCSTVPVEAKYNFSYFWFLSSTELRVPATWHHTNDVSLNGVFTSTGGMYWEECILIQVFSLMIEPLTQIIESLAEWDREYKRCNYQSYAENRQICGRRAASC